jgi:hypothetical protein
MSPSRTRADDDVQLATLGVNAVAGAVRASVFATLTFFEDSTSGTRERTNEITLRTAAAF